MHRKNQLKCNDVAAVYLALAAAALCSMTPTALCQDQLYPAMIRLPDDQRAEGIASGDGDTFYATSATNARILKGDVKSGAYSTLVTGKGGAGLKFDSRSGLLYVCEIAGGSAAVYNGTTGAEVTRFQFGTPGDTVQGPAGAAIVNDCVVTKNAAYFTDSHNATLYRVALGANAQPAATFTTIPLPADFTWPATSGPYNAFVNANGIAATADEKFLILVHTGLGRLYRMDTSNSEVVRIAINGGDGTDAGRGDGILLDGTTLYVVQNRINRIAVMTMSSDFLSATITGYISEPFASNATSLKVPTTMAKISSGLYVVTGALVPPGPYYVARLSHPDPKFSSITYRENNGTLVNVKAEPGGKYDIQYSIDLKGWNALATVVNSNDPYLAARDSTRHWFIDSAAPSLANRFYRAVKNLDSAAFVGDHLATGAAETPESITADSSGNVYMSMAALNKIRKVNPYGVASDFAEIPGPGATLGLKVDAQGNLYAAHPGAPSNIGVWKVAPDGKATLFANLTEAGTPNDLALDSQGNVYVTDSAKGIVWKVTAQGNASNWMTDPRLAPQTPPVPFPFSPGPGANGIAFSQTKGVVYVMNTTAGILYQAPVNANGTAGELSVLAKDNSLVGGDGITLDASGNIYVGNNAYSRILKVTPAGALTALTEGGPINISSSVTFVPGGDQNTLYVCNFGFPVLKGNPALAGLLKLDLASKVASPVTYFNQDIVFAHPRYSQHATVLMKWGHRTVYADPAVIGGADAASVFQGFPSADLIVITHFHGDHFDTNALKVLARPTTAILAPQSVYDLMPDSLKAVTTIMRNGEKIDKVGVRIETIPAYNFVRPNHPKGRDNGYVLTLGGKRIYIPGDTEDIPEMRALKNIDVAFLCMNLPFTMDVEQAASAVREFKPKVVYPFHFNGVVVTPSGPDFSKALTSDVARFKELVGKDAGVEVRVRRWYEPLQLADRIAADQSEIVIQPIQHAAVLMTWNGKRIYNDPSSGTESKVADRIALFQGYPQADLISITHLHPDHFDTNVLEILKGPNTRIVAPQTVFDLMPSSLKAITTVMKNGETATVAGIPIEAIPSYNLDPATVRHPKGRDNGYVLTLGGKRIYFAGDTEDSAEMRALKNIDVAFVPMIPPFAMSAARAANAVREFKPKIVYPFHFINATGGTAEDPSGFKRLVGTDLGIEVRIRPFYSSVH